MAAAHTFHQNQNNSELMTRRKSVTHLIDQQGCDEPDIVYAQASHERANLSPLNSEPIHLAVSAAENHFQLA